MNEASKRLPNSPLSMSDQYLRQRNVIIPGLEKDLQDARDELSSLKNAQLQSDAVWTWPGLESEGKLLWEALRRLSLREGSLTLSLQLSGLGALYGRSEKSGRRAYEGKKGVLEAGVIVERDRVGGRITIELQDPLAVQRARLARESEEQLELDLLQQASAPIDQASISAAVVATAVVDPQPPSEANEVVGHGALVAKTAAVVGPQPPFSLHRDIEDIVPHAQHDMDIARDKEGTPRDPLASQISETGGGCGPTTAGARSTTADHETVGDDLDDAVEPRGADENTGAVERQSPIDERIAAIKSAWKALRGRLPEPSAQAEAAQWISARIFDIVADVGFPRGLAEDVGWAYVEGDITQKDLVDIGTYLVQGRDSKGEPIESRGGYARQAILFRCRDILGRRSDRGPSGSGEAIKRILGGPPKTKAARS